MYMKIDLDFMKSEEISAQEKIVYLTLKSYLPLGKETGEVYPSVSTLCKVLGMTHPTVEKIINGLISRGLLQKQKVKGKNNRYVIKSYAPDQKQNNAPGNKKTEKPKNSFHNFEQRTYDYDQIEKQLLNKQNKR